MLPANKTKKLVGAVFWALVVTGIVLLLTGCDISIPEATVLPSSSPVKEFEVVQECINLSSELVSEGVLVVSGEGSPYSLLDLETFITSSLPFSSQDVEMAISPDGYHLAYVERIIDQAGQTMDLQLRIIKANADQEVSIHWDEHWSLSRIQQWLTNDRIYGEVLGYPTGVLFKLDMLTKSWLELKPIFPDLYSAFNYPPAYWPPAYDPFLERVVYPTDLASDYGAGYALWDIQTQQVLWLQSDSVAPFYPARWSPNGQYFAITTGETSSGQSFLIMNRDGLTLLPSTLLENVQDFSWSPDSQQIALWQDTGQDSGYRLLILDLSLKRLVDTCITNPYKTSWAPVWSPNGQQLAVNAQIEGLWRGIIIDLGLHKAASLPDGISVRAWMRRADSGEMIWNNSPEAPLSFSAWPQTDAVRQHCLDIDANLEPSLISTGTIVLENNDQLVILQHDSTQLIALDGAPKINHGGYVSPNKEYLAYIAYDENQVDQDQLYITDVIEKQIMAVPWSERQERLIGWLNDSQLIFTVDEGNIPLFYDPFAASATKGVFSYNFFSPYGADCEFCPGQVQPTLWQIFSPTASQVAYYEYGFGIDQPGIKLWDLASKKQVWNFLHWKSFFSQPIWSPNGDQVVIALPIDEMGLHNEFFTVDNDGQMTQLTHLAETYPVSIIRSPAWSPDGKHIAFWLDARLQEDKLPEYPRRLLVVNTETHQAIDYCIPGFFVSSDPAVWSPDSQQIAIESYLDESNSRIVIVDIVQNRAFEIARNYRLIGWMIEP